MIPAAPSGLLLIDKPAAWTSHDAVAALRRFFPRRTKVGHTGTLDPMATGLLVVLVGKATKDAARLQGLPKVYEGRVRFGVETETGDLEGALTRQAPVPALDSQAIAAILAGFAGDNELPVPSYSAVKHAGKPLYKYARSGAPAPEKRRVMRVEEWRLLSWRSPEAEFLLSCASGTYVRSLAVEAGRRLGCGATLSALRRTAVGPFELSKAMTVEDARRLGSADPGALARVLAEVPALA